VRILIRCDGGGARGVGHLLRSLSVAHEARARGHEVVLAGAFEGEFVTQALASADVELLAVASVAADPTLAGRSLARLAEEVGADVVHVDDYDLPPVLDVLAVSLTSTMEDGAFGARGADVRIDPTLGADLEPAPPGRGVRLRGSRFTPVRPEVTALRDRRAGTTSSTTSSTARPAVLVVMGGTDPQGAAPLVTQALAATGHDLDLTVVARPDLTEAVRRAAGGLPVRVIEPTPGLPALMAASDLVVSAAGTSVWELCVLGVPMALVLAVANQRPGYERMLALDAATGLGTPEQLRDSAVTADRLAPLLVDPQRRAELGAAASRLVDGLGAWRVVAAWEALVASRVVSTAAEPHEVRVRPAAGSDAHRLHEWRNDPQTRAASRTQDPVPWEDHLRWLEASLRRDDRRLFVASDDAGDVGTIRWDREGQGEWEVSITVAPRRRGQRLAGALLAAGERALAEAVPGRELTAYLAVVHEENAASVRLFAAAGYLPELPADAAGYRRYFKPAGSLTPDIAN
jgi:spore coat polysaccharide biosynthesis predicted glycosyltransferase SpsG/RimJ/RimL family protein N-acetyltransferase